MRKFLAISLMLAMTAYFSALPAMAQSMGATAIVQGGNTAVVNGSGQLSVNCGNCTGSGASLVDEAAFTEGTTSFAPVGGQYITSPTNLTSGQGGVVLMTNTRHLMVNIADALPTGANTIGAISNTAFGATQSGTWTVQPGNTANSTAWLVTGTGGTFPASESGTWNVGLSAGANTVGAVTQASGPWTMNLTQMGGTAIVANPCWEAIPTEANVNLTATGQIITGTSSKQTYICSLSLVVNGADNIALVEGTGTNCGTSTAGMAGGTTAATGWNFAANGGLAHGAGIGPVYRTATAADNVCILASGSSQISGSAMYVQE
jgi:hypothetical protein